jgi:hypothetical protein
MYKNDGSFSPVITNQTGYEQMTNYNNIINTNPNNNVLINNYFNTKKEGGIQKKVKFNNEVEIYNVESYKEHNKKFCYNINEEDYQYLNSEDKYKENFNKYLKKFKNNNNYNVQQKTEKSNDCCCILI